MPWPRSAHNVGLPARWVHRNGALYYRVPVNEQHLPKWRGATWVRLGATLEEAHARWPELAKAAAVSHGAYTSKKMRAERAQKCPEGIASPIDIARLQAMHASAKGSRHACTLTLLNLIAMARRSGGRCELTGITFDTETKSRSGKALWAPSLDRIDAGGSYSPDNCRLVCVAANIALSDFGTDAFARMAFGYAERAKNAA